MIVKDKRCPISAGGNCRSLVERPQAPSRHLRFAGGERRRAPRKREQIRNAGTHGFGWVPAFLICSNPHHGGGECPEQRRRMGHPISRVANARGSDASAALRLRSIPHPQGPALNPSAHLHERSSDSRRVGPGRIHCPGRAVQRGHSAPVPQATDRVVPMRRRARPGRVALAERRLASTRFDTCVSTPTKPVPAYLAEQR